MEQTAREATEAGPNPGSEGPESRSQRPAADAPSAAGQPPADAPTAAGQPPATADGPPPGPSAGPTTLPAGPAILHPQGLNNAKARYMCKTSERRIKLYLPEMPPSSAWSSAAEVLWGCRRSSCWFVESGLVWEQRTTRLRCWPSSTGRAASLLPTSS